MDNDDTHFPRRPAALTQDQDDFRIGAAASHHHNTEVAPDTCTICLESITDRAVIVPCDHLSFDFACLAQWLKDNTTCPLCKTEVHVVQYAWRGPHDYKTYEIRRRDGGDNGKVRGNVAHAASRARLNTQHDVQAWIQPEDPALNRRRRVYAETTFSLHIGSNERSGYAEFTATTFAASPELQRRARTFLRRELRVFHLPAQGRITGEQARRDWLMEYIVAILKVNDVKAADGHAVTLIAENVGEDEAPLLVHELTAWLRSPFESLEVWDGVVQYLSTVASATGCASVATLQH